MQRLGAGQTSAHWSASQKPTKGHYLICTWTNNRRALFTGIKPAPLGSSTRRRPRIIWIALILHRVTRARSCFDLWLQPSRHTLTTNHPPTPAREAPAAILHYVRSWWLRAGNLSLKSPWQESERQKPLPLLRAMFSLWLIRTAFNWPAALRMCHSASPLFPLFCHESLIWNKLECGSCLMRADCCGEKCLHSIEIYFDRHQSATYMQVWKLI